MRIRTLRGSLGATAVVSGLLAGLPGLASTQAAQALPDAITPVSCSVSALVSAISGASTGDTLLLAPHCTYRLTTVNNTTDGANGLPLITNKVLTLIGRDTTIERSSATGTPRFRIFEVAGSGRTGLRLLGITLRNGLASGLFGLASDGGCILVKGAAPPVAPTTPRSAQPALPIPTALTLVHSAVEGCSSRGLGSGGGIYLGSGAVAEIDLSALSDNFTLITGGGLYVADHAAARLVHTVVTDNSALLTGGGIYAAGDSVVRLTSATVQGNTALNGGGIFIARDGILVAGRSLLLDNSATISVAARKAAGKAPVIGRGGGLFNDGNSAFSNGSVAGNKALVDGGGIYTNGRLLLGATLVAQNSVLQSGGGVYADVDASTRFAAVKFEFNTALVSGGAIGNAGHAFLQNSFVGNNTSPFGGGIWEGRFLGMLVANSAILNNIPNNCRPVNSVPLCAN